jgi:UDP-N-acetylglucosamine 2-epimerase (non-hydrolysing)
MNRQLTGRITTYHFSPTPLSRQNLLDEGVSEDKIIVTGNTVIDALHWVLKKINSDHDLQTSIHATLLNSGYDISKLSNGKRMILITGHRRENFGQGFIQMCQAIKTLTEKYPEVDFIYPMHLNPNVRKPIHQVFKEKLDSLGNMFFIEPLEYIEFVTLMERSHIVLTDSGGIQEEAPSLGKPVLVMRDTTERPEAVTAGTVKLVGTDYDTIVNSVTTLLEDNNAYLQMSLAINPYGDGKACERIVTRLRTI